MNILITGGASGLGRAITQESARNPSNIIYFTFNSSSANARELERYLPNAHGIKCNFTDEKELAALIAKMREMDLDVLINNAITGIMKGYFHKIPAEKFLGSFCDNVLPVIRITQKAIEVFRTKMSGRIVTILSTALAHKPPIGWSEYTANKAYLLALTRSWASENGRFNITANCVSPSLMRTKLTGDMDEREMERIISAAPIKRLLTVEETAKRVLELVNASANINAQNIRLDGVDLRE